MCSMLQTQMNNILFPYMYLEQGYGELGMCLSGDPDTTRVMHALRLSDGVQQLIHEVQAKMTVLQEHPASLEYVHVCGYACVEIWQ